VFYVERHRRPSSNRIEVLLVVEKLKILISVIVISRAMTTTNTIYTLDTESVIK
jgi:hypothetical protein